MIESGVAVLDRRRPPASPADPSPRPARRDERPDLVHRFAKVPAPAVILSRRLACLAPPRQVEPCWQGTRGSLA